VNLGADRCAGQVVLDAGRDVRGLDLDAQRVELDGDQAARARLTDDVQLHINGDPLAAVDDDQVDMLDRQPDRVPLDIFRKRELGATVELDGQQGVGVLECQHRRVARQRNVHRVGAVAVENGRHQVVTAQSTRSTLAELIARRGAELHLGHN
jgi:hypothetical protein